MFPGGRCVLIGMVVLAAGSAHGQETCQERVLTLRFSPSAGRANNWCWAATGQMIMELLGEPQNKACQCQQAEQVLGVKGCCVTPSSCLPADELPVGCDRPRWPAFVEKPQRYSFDYTTTCDGLKDRQDDEACDAKPLGWRELTAEICAGRPVIASLRARGSARGHTVVVKGFSTRPNRRVLVVDPMRLCSGRDCEGELDEGFWLTYEEYAAGWGGMVHWVDFFGIRKR
jgi:Peptidase_C39 like family